MRAGRRGNRAGAGHRAVIGLVRRNSQGCGHIGGAGKAVGRVFVEGGLHGLHYRRGSNGLERFEIGRRVHNSMDNLGQRFPGKGMPAGHQFKQNDAERKEIGPAIDSFIFDLFGGGIQRCANGA